MGCRQSRFGRVYLRGQVFGQRIVQLLLRDQPRLRFCRLLQTLIVGVQRGVPGLFRGHFMLCPDNLIRTARHLGNRAFQLSLQFRDFQNRKCLPLPHPVADIHPYGTNETGNLGVNIDHLVGLELPGESQNMRNRTPPHHRHPCSGRFWSGLDTGTAVGTEDKPCGQSDDCASRNQEIRRLRI
jgi:hypothetical protein